jgi:branched-chain amino acid transport system substrate-binding protein
VSSIVLTGGLVACGDDDDGDSGGGGGGGDAALDLKIGDSVPLSGDLADFGPPGQKAADVAVAEINKAIKEAGRDDTVSVEHADNETTEQAAVQAARQLVAGDASCIAGAWASSGTIPTARSVAIPEEVLLISPASTADEISDIEDDGLVNRTAPPDRYQGPTLANLIAEDIGGAEGKTISLGARNDAYGNGLVDTFSAAWEGLGGEIAGEPVVYDPTQPSYDSEAQDIVGANADAIAIFDFPETFVKVAPALVRTGEWDPKTTFVTDGLISGDLLESPGGDVLAGLRGTAPGAPDDDPASQAFGKLYESSEPKDVARQVFDAQNFDAVVLCYLAAVAAGSTDGADMAEGLVDITGPGGTEYTWEQLPEAIEALANGDDIDYQGASGPIDMNEDGDATAGVYDIYTFSADDLVATGEVEVTAPE